MPSTCVVPFCSERSGGHKFPRDKILREKWILAIRRVNFQPSEYSKVCKKHFKKEDYRLPKESTVKYPAHVLKKDAVPSKFSWNEKSFKAQKENNGEKRILLGQRCSVLQCKSGSSKNIILHSCPNQESVRKKWAEVFKVNREVVKNMLICSQHFLKTDYINSKNGECGLLKQNAVPSQKLPRSTRIINMRKKVFHSKKKTLIRPKPPKRAEKMKEVIDEELNVNQKEEIHECRACLKKMENNASTCNIFQSWVPPWTGMEATIAEDLAKLANVEVFETDLHSKIICQPCYSKLLEASTFVAQVRDSDQILKQRYTTELENTDKVWPKPIQVDKNVNSNVYQDMDVEIKQEIVSDDEYCQVPTENTYAPENNEYCPVSTENSYAPENNEYCPVSTENSYAPENNEYCPVSTENSYAPENNEAALGHLDIKIEPEEIVEPLPFVELPPYEEGAPYGDPPPLTITINGTMSLKSPNGENKTLLNGTDNYEAIITDSTQNTGLANGNEMINYDEQYIQATVKEEPLSEEEDDLEQFPDLSLDCLLCTKSFNSVTGLKAHVIAQHSYKSVKRKVAGVESPQKKPKVEYRCQICRRAFVTSTDLMVHETCHNKHSCYGCTRKFDTFKQLSKHRKRCNLPVNKTAVKPKTLDDVKRPVKNEKPSSLDLSTVEKKEKCLNDSSMNSNLEIKSSKNKTKTVQSEMEEHSSDTDEHMEL
ncbi:unnamed protein product [Arctia plantaginis]|uniref:Uncharacterized protein n=1 Tax=Arctia plantaginis TaxID=874455 RepID=A0A8S1A9H8_ARCPL|nr:unnamed protein product [Arctia plantaginis]